MTPILPVRLPLTSSLRSSGADEPAMTNPSSVTRGPHIRNALREALFNLVSLPSRVAQVYWLVKAKAAIVWLPDSLRGDRFVMLKAGFSFVLL
jgi:hypothetical protein